MPSPLPSVPPIIVRKVVTTSMAPLLKPGDLIRVSAQACRTQDAGPKAGAAPRVGEVWAYWTADGRSLIVHRVVQVQVQEQAPGLRRYRFQGDALLLPDEGGAWIDAERIHGRAEARFRDGKWTALVGFKARILGACFGLWGALNAAGRGCVRRFAHPLRNGMRRAR